MGLQVIGSQGESHSFYGYQGVNPRNEMRGLVALTRLLTEILPGMAKKPKRIFLAGDSECTISSVDCREKILDTWLANRVSEVQDHFQEWREMGIKVEDLYHWPGRENIVDLATKGEATWKDIDFGSTWQNGP